MVTGHGWTPGRVAFLAIPLLCLTLLLIVDPALPESFSSIAELKQLVVNEGLLLDQVDSYIRREEQRIQEVRSLAASIRNQSLHHEPGREEDIVGHPVNAFNLVKNWARLYDLSYASGTSSSFQELQSFAKSRGMTLPGERDYGGALAALIRLQKTYQLPADELARGRVQDRAALSPLAPDDLYQLGRIAREVDHAMARDLFLQCLEALQDGPGLEPPTGGETAANPSGTRATLEGPGGQAPGLFQEVTFTKADVYTALAAIYKQNGDLLNAREMQLKAAVQDPANQGVMEELTRLRERIKKSGDISDFKPPRMWTKFIGSSREAYQKLCRGENITNDITVTPSLVCRYKSGLLPYVRYREEIHSFRPYISLFLDVISDSEAARIRDLAYPQLHRAAVGDPSIFTPSDSRVSKTAWLWDTDAFVKQISDRVQDITGLSTTLKTEFSHAESFQIVNYGMAGQYEPHYDYYESDEMLSKVPPFIIGTGDRIATFMFYLNHVEAGGATVYPEVGVRVPPTQNAAAFWYNFNLKGDRDKRTLHAGCPVLLGQKWVANKWIREIGQAFRRPCPLDRDTIDEL